MAMVTKKFPLSGETLTRISEYDASLTHWSVEYVRRKHELDELDARIKTINQAKVQTVQKVLSDEDLDKSKIQRLSVEPGENGGYSLHVLVEED